MLDVSLQQGINTRIRILAAVQMVGFGLGRSKMLYLSRGID
jgi:hypothetical protein